MNALLLIFAHVLTWNFRITEAQNYSSANCTEGNLKHAESGKCYEANIYCPGLMLFYDIGDGYGECDCIESCFIEEEAASENTTFSVVTYWRPHSRCYYLNTRGPCGPREWLVLDSISDSESAICKPNPCIRPNKNINKNVPPEFYWIYEYGKCWKSGTQAYCDDDYILRARIKESGQFTTKCVHKMSLTYTSCHSAGYFSIPCRRGFKFSQKHSKCQRRRRFF